MGERDTPAPRPGWLTQARRDRGWTQAEAARRLGISQGYLSLIERGVRRVSSALLPAIQRVYTVPAAALPLVDPSTLSPARLAAALARLGYPPFAHLRGRTRLNPAALMLGALRHPDLEARLTEALPWVALHHVDLDWNWLLARAKSHDVQNRLGYVIALAGRLAERGTDVETSRQLGELTRTLERSRLCREDTLCRDTMTTAERTWLRARRSRLARHWNLLTDLRTDSLPYGPKRDDQA